ncbi:Imm31 family immunity protein [Salinivibrio sp. ML290]|uniref:Imm31 family immunity protein n=1 Tax=Salinivibrio sp. ML290 TaxID=1909468 RepID=UPI0009CAA934|nr:Imm31 family immunity protein [Salinivibrio sp. ML290]OOE71293.1 hypothetical protein BZG23_16275 [Salinivibrio sp. ML290]
MQALYEFFEVVKITSSDSAFAEVKGQEAVILGMTPDDTGHWFYSVQITDTEEVWSLSENDIESTGKVLKKENFYYGDSVTVRVGHQSGEGYLKDS